MAILKKNTEPFGYLNGEFSELKNLKVPVMDRGFIYGDGVYEVIPVYHKKPFALQEHLSRLFDNLDKISIPLDEGQESLKNIVFELLKQTDSQFEYIYLQVTRGTYEKREHIYPNEIKPTIFAYLMPFTPPSLESQQQGIKAIIREDNRWDRCDIKSISLLGNVLLRQDAQLQNASETLLHRNGYLTEGSISNVFIVVDGIIKTPKLNNFILPGITRSKVIKTAKECDFICKEEDIRIQEVKEADEIWVTSSTKEIIPVRVLEDKVMSKNIDQSIWKKIFIAFQSCK